MTRLSLIQDLAPKTFAEIGVCEGEFSEQLAAIKSIRQLWLVDSWKAYDGDYAKDPANVSQPGQDDRHRRVVQKFLKQRGRVRIMRMESLVAVNWFPDKSLDAVLIDANHTENAVYADLCAWSAKTKVILCHDYTDSPEALAMGFGTIPAVRKFIEKFPIWKISYITHEEWPTVMLEKALP